MHRVGRLGATLWTAHSLISDSTPNFGTTCRAFRYYHPTHKARTIMSETAGTTSIHGRSDNKPSLRGVIFDMDGTLTIPNLDFAEMYDRCGVDRKQDILTALAAMDEASAARANAIIDEMEEEGRRSLQLMPGALNLLQWLAYYQIPTALVTRNTLASTHRLMELLRQADPGLPSFSPIISRDFRPTTIRPKPHTDALEYIAKAWKMDLTKDLVMVGDSPANDMVFGKNAGVSTALLWQTQGNKDDTEMASMIGGDADVVVSKLVELPRYFHQNFVLPPSLCLEEISSEIGTSPQPTSVAGKAAYHGDLDSLRSLSLEEIVLKDSTGTTPLIWASEAGQREAVEYLLGTLVDQHENHINERGFRGSTAISRASRNDHVDLVNVLTKHPKLNPNIPNVKLQYPLHVAAFRQYSSIVKALLQSGADPHVIDRKGRTPLEDTNCPKTKELLEEAMS